MVELLMGGWALFQVAALFAMGIVVAILGLAAVFGPIAWLIWYFSKDVVKGPKVDSEE